MELPIQFKLIEDHAFTGPMSIKLKGNHIRFAGFNGDRKPIPVNKVQANSFASLLMFLDLPNWKSDYNPEECGFQVLDGKSWSFVVSIDGNSYRSGGINAYPSFQGTDCAERYGLLILGLKSIFGIDGVSSSIEPRSRG